MIIYFESSTMYVQLVVPQKRFETLSSF